MLRLQSALCGTDGHATQIGDSSDDSLFPLDGGSGGNASALREIERALFESELAIVADGHPGRTRAWWLLGGRLAPTPRDAAMAAMVALEEGGIVVFGEDGDATRCTLRTGPVAGTRYLPGHQHADALSVTLTRRGIPLLVDAGTCSYRFHASDKKSGGVNWRSHFAGARAHNGLVVEGHDPYGQMRGDFRSTGRLPEVSRTGSANGRELSFHEARLDAHEHFPGWTRGVVHLRDVALIVYDCVTAGMVHTPMHFAFQWAPQCEVVHSEDMRVIARASGIGVHLAWSQGLGPGDVVCGREHPTNGWVSPAYGERVPAPQLLVPVTHASELTAFALAGDEGTRTLAVECEAPATSVRAFRIVSDMGVELVLLNLGSPVETVEAYGIAFEGCAAWIRIPDTGRPSVHWLQGRACVAPQWSIRYAFPAPVSEFAG
jgi:hypothetical protein